MTTARMMTVSLRPPLLPSMPLSMQDHTSAPVIAKYDQLTRGTQQLVQAAAVIGQEVSGQGWGEGQRVV